MNNEALEQRLASAKQPENCLSIKLSIPREQFIAMTNFVKTSDISA
jgi:hypothetical protein